MASADDPQEDFPVTIANRERAFTLEIQYSRVRAQRLATAVRQRRGELGLSQEAITGVPATISLPTLKAIESGALRKYQATTLADLDRTMRWEPGTAESIFYGPVTFGGPDVPSDYFGSTDEGRFVLDAKEYPTMTVGEKDLIERLGTALIRQGRAWFAEHPVVPDRLRELVAVANMLFDDDLALVVDLARRLAPPDGPDDYGGGPDD